MDKNRVVRERVALFCPVHNLGLVKSTITERIESFKGTPRQVKPGKYVPKSLTTHGLPVK